MMANDLCPCGTQKTYSECCEPYHKGKAPATAADLMRSRYAAFAKHEIDYILNTVAPAKRADFDRAGIETWAKRSEWTGLDIVATEKGGPADTTGTVEFVAKYKEGGEERKHDELATFVKIDGRWFFEDGATPKVKPIRREGPAIGRNDPCHCGSGKKFKKCHGA